MAVAMIGPKFYAWDRNGKPLAFGKLYTYEARTNNPKDTYQSEDKIVANTNPVILNGEGYANIYLDGSYKMVLKDLNDNEIWTSDPVTANQPIEWVNCLAAAYVSSVSFVVAGNFTAEYEAGRSVRLNDGTVNYIYSVIKSSSFAGGNTTVIVETPVVTVGVQGSCVSIVGPNSTGVNISNARYGASFETEAAMAAGTALDGGFIDFSVKDPARVVGEDGSIKNYVVVSGGALPDILLHNGLWAKSLSSHIEKGNASGFSDPIIRAPLQGGTEQKWWANWFSQNFIMGDGGGNLNEAASGAKDGNNNTGFGFGVFGDATTSYACAAFGFQALGALTTGDSSTAFGYQALSRATTGENNTAVGVDAGFNVTTGSNNTLIGRHIFFEGSGTTDATGNNNVAMGYDIALGATTLANNVLIGANAHRDGVTSSGTVVMGSNCAQDGAPLTSSVLIGYLNNQNRPLAGSVTESVEIGFRVHQNNVGASNFNVLIGTRAFYSGGVEAVATSSNNVAIGTDVGGKVSGISNVLVGSRAGAQATDVERNGMVCIGNRAGDGYAIDNDLIISNNQIATNALINGNFSTRILQLEAAELTMRNIPTVGTGTSGTIWNDGGTLKVVP